MPIDAQCPHCMKRYKFKEDLLGKKVKCANQPCRQVFEVKHVPIEDAETRAMKALADEPDPIAAIPEDKRTVPMVCVACEHKWDVAWNLINKNVICPECRNRQKVPEPKAGNKKIDWRDPKAGRPTLAKTEVVPDDVWGGAKEDVSFTALKEAGAIEPDEVEPRPLKQKVMIYGGGLALVLALGLGIMMYLKSGKTAKYDGYVAEALKDAEGMKDQGFKPSVAGAVEGCLRMYVAEYFVRAETPEKFKSAMGQFGQARTLLDTTGKGLDRDVALGEWMVALLCMGGTEEQAKASIRMRWTPEDRSNARAKMNEKEYSVVEELQSVCEIMKRTCDLDSRLAAFRKLCAAANSKGQGVLLESLVGSLFKEDEELEARGMLGLEFARTSNPKANEMAEMLKGLIPEQSSAPGSVRALWAATQMPGTNLPPLVGEINYATRTAHALSKVMEKNTAGAAEDAARPGTIKDRVLALALVAEYSEDPSAAVAKAQELLNTDGGNKESMAMVPAYAWVRLARAAGVAGKDDAAKAFASAVADDAAKAMALAEMVRGKTIAGASKKVDADFADWTEDPKKMQLGHFLARYWYARHNASATGDSAAIKTYEGWPKGLAKPFGLVGFALGMK